MIGEPPRRSAAEAPPAAPERTSRAERRDWLRKQARVQRELAVVQNRWERSLLSRPDGSSPTRPS